MIYACSFHGGYRELEEIFAYIGCFVENSSSHGCPSFQKLPSVHSEDSELHPNHGWVSNGVVFSVDAQGMEFAGERIKAWQ